MKLDYNDYEYNSIIEDILENRQFNKLKDIPHHKTNRLEHSRRVSYISYKICKRLNLDYVSAARAGLLHDFFVNKYTPRNSGKLLKRHPKLASFNAKKHFKLNRKEINIIESHMFPLIVKCKPKYKESYIVLVSDKVVWAYEKLSSYINIINNKIRKACIYILHDI